MGVLGISEFMAYVLVFGVPAFFTIANIYQLVKKVKKIPLLLLEGIGIPVGLGALVLFNLGTVELVMWDQPILSVNQYPPFDISRAWQLIAVLVLGVLGWAFLRFVPMKKQPPLVTVLSFAAIYLFFIELVIFMIQTFSEGLFYYTSLVYALNILIVIAKLIREQILFRKEQPVKEQLTGIRNLLSKAAALPVLGFLLLALAIGVLLLILILFGQAPDELIKVWTNTAEWTFSQRTPPPRLPYDGHYLCTVAANGHRRLVKPIRTGKRHGHTVLVNRQLMIANAFEDLIRERTPGFHRLVRGFYDKTGLPISRYITTKLRSDAVYLIMKPLEWVFLVTLYLFDPQPENRIAVQYPDTPTA